MLNNINTTICDTARTAGAGAIAIHPGPATDAGGGGCPHGCPYGRSGLAY